MGAEPAWSTGVVDPDPAFDFWRDLICDAFVQLSARPGGEAPFRGSIEHEDLDPAGSAAWPPSPTA